MVQTVELELELDSSELQHQALLGAGGVWVGEREWDGVRVEITASEEGHGFGIAEVITVLISIGVGVTTDVVVDALKYSVKGLIRRARSKDSESDGSNLGLQELIDDSRQDVDQQQTSHADSKTAGPN